MSVNKKTFNKLITFEDFYTFYGVRHYGDKQTYNSINLIWKLIFEKINQYKIIFLNFEQLMNYLYNKYDSAEPNFRFMYWYVINEFNRYQSNVELYYQDINKYNNRLIGYCKTNKCHNLRKLKQNLDARIKKINVNTLERTRNFLIFSRYICDYFEDFPEEIPPKLFNYY